MSPWADTEALQTLIDHLIPHRIRHQRDERGTPSVPPQLRRQGPPGVSCPKPFSCERTERQVATAEAV